MKNKKQPKMTMHERARIQAFKNVMERKKAQEEQQFLTEAHRKNEETAEKQIAEWQASPPTLEEALKKQRERERVYLQQE